MRFLYKCFPARNMPQDNFTYSIWGSPKNGVNPLDGVSRRDPYLKQLLQREKRAAKRSAKQKRSKAALAVDLELDSGSSSSSSDTE